MSDTSSLTELARFVGRSRLAETGSVGRRAVNDIVNHGARRPSPTRVSDLLAVVLTLSARTRRLVMPRVEIDIDVFMPDGQRAVRIVFPQ